MNDFIKREDAIEALTAEFYITGRENARTILNYLDLVKTRIKAIPSADRPQGEWIEIGTISHSYKCSVCGRTLFNITVGKNHVAKYCPYCHCGARMKGADDE